MNYYMNKKLCLWHNNNEISYIILKNICIEWKMSGKNIPLSCQFLLLYT